MLLVVVAVVAVAIAVAAVVVGSNRLCNLNQCCQSKT